MQHRFERLLEWHQAYAAKKIKQISGAEHSHPLAVIAARHDYGRFAMASISDGLIQRRIEQRIFDALALPMNDVIESRNHVGRIVAAAVLSAAPRRDAVLDEEVAELAFAALTFLATVCHVWSLADVGRV